MMSAKWEGLDTMLALSAAGDMAVPEQEMMDVKEEVKEEPLSSSCSMLGCFESLTGRHGAARRGRRYRHPIVARLPSRRSPPRRS